jgi:hypothetical protein
VLAENVYDDNLVDFLLYGYSDYQKRIYKDYPINLFRNSKGAINEILETVIPLAAKKKPDYPKEKWESILTRLKNGEKSMLTKDNLLPELREKYERKVRNKYNEKSYSVEEFAYREALKFSAQEKSREEAFTVNDGHGYLVSSLLEKVRDLRPERIKKPTLWERWGAAAKPVSVETAQGIQPSTIEPPPQAALPAPPKRRWFWGGKSRKGKSRKGKSRKSKRKGKARRTRKH